MKIPFAIAVALGAATCGHPPPPVAERPPAPPDEVRVAPPRGFVKVEPVTASSEGGLVSATARVTFDEERVSRVGAPLSGRVQELVARPGDHVKKGQPLLVIASPDVESAVSEFVAADADRAVAQKSLERAQRLYADRAVPYKDVLQAESDATKADAAVARTRSRLEVLGIEPSPASRSPRFSVRSPLEGIVVERPALPGMEVRADSGTPLLTVADLSRLWVIADVYERDLGLVSVGQQATVHVTAYPGETFTGQVTHIGELVDPQTRTVKVRVEVANPRLRLKPEMYARVTFAGGRDGPPAIAIPSEAVLSDGEASAVIVALGEDRFQKRAIDAGPEQDGRVRVLAGLQTGERVVVDGALFLKAEIDAR